jgi:hypothetical protein
MPPGVMIGSVVPATLAAVAGGGAVAGVAGGSFSFAGVWHILGYFQSLLLLSQVSVAHPASLSSCLLHAAAHSARCISV